MTDEMKVLIALCEALGFEIEKTLDYDEREESPEDAKEYWKPFPSRPTTGRELVADRGAYVIDDEGYYTSRLIEPTRSYTVRRVAPGE